MVYDEANKDLVEELECSLVGETLTPIEIEVLERKFKDTNPSIQYVKEIGAYKFLITFLSVKDKDEALKDERDVLKKTLDEIRE